MSDQDPHRLPEDPSGEQGPHDVLAAEEFPVPTRNPSDLPVDPIHEPHDVLAAEEFAIPTAGATHEKGGIQLRSVIPSAVLGALFALLVVHLLRDR